MQRFFILRGQQASAPMAAMWIEALRNMIVEDGDSMEVFRSDIGCNWLYCIQISTTACNFTDDVKVGIVPKMCDPRMNLGSAWQETNRQGFLNLKEEIARVKKVQAQKDAELAERSRSHKQGSNGYWSETIGRAAGRGGCSHAVGWCNCR